MIILPDGSASTAPQASKYALRIIGAMAQSNQPFHACDGGVSHSSRWNLAEFIDGVIKQAVEDFVEWSDQPEGDNGNGTEDTTVGH